MNEDGEGRGRWFGGREPSSVEMSQELNQGGRWIFDPSPQRVISGNLKDSFSIIHYERGREGPPLRFRQVHACTEIWISGVLPTH